MKQLNEFTYQALLHKINSKKTGIRTIYKLSDDLMQSLNKFDSYHFIHALLLTKDCISVIKTRSKMIVKQMVVDQYVYGLSSIYKHILDYQKEDTLTQLLSQIPTKTKYIWWHIYSIDDLRLMHETLKNNTANLEEQIVMSVQIPSIKHLGTQTRNKIAWAVAKELFGADTHLAGYLKEDTLIKENSVVNFIRDTELCLTHLKRIMYEQSETN